MERTQTPAQEPSAPTRPDEWRVRVEAFEYNRYGAVLLLDVHVDRDPSLPVVGNGKYLLVYDSREASLTRSSEYPLPYGPAGSREAIRAVLDIARREMEARGVWHGCESLRAFPYFTSWRMREDDSGVADGPRAEDIVSPLDQQVEPALGEQEVKAHESRVLYHISQLLEQSGYTIRWREKRLHVEIAGKDPTRITQRVTVDTLQPLYHTSVDQYQQALAAYPACPACGSAEDTEALGDLEGDFYGRGEVYRAWRCRLCGSSWRDVYTFSAILPSEAGTSE